MVNAIVFVGLSERSQMLARLKRHEDDAEVIMNAVSETLNISIEDMKSPKRQRPIVEARCIAIGLILQVKPEYGLKRLGIAFGNRDHSTIIYQRNTFDALYKRDKGFTNKVYEVLKKV